MKQHRTNKRGATAPFILVAMGVLIALVLVGGVFFWQKMDIKNPFDVGKTGSGDPVTSVNPTLASTLLVTGKDTYNDTLLAGSFTYYLNGKKASGTIGTAVSVGLGDSYEVVFDDAQHYVGTASGKIGRVGPNSEELAMSPNTSALTATFYNAAGTAASAQALGANSKEYVQVRLQVPPSLTFGNPKSPIPAIGCIVYNTTEISTLKIHGGSSVAVPKLYKGTAQECWTLPFTSLSDGAKVDFQPYVEATSTNPAGDATLYVIDPELFTATTNDGSQKVGDRVWGYENNAGTDIGTGNVAVTLDFS